MIEIEKSDIDQYTKFGYEKIDIDRYTKYGYVSDWDDVVRCPSLIDVSIDLKNKPSKMEKISKYDFLQTDLYYKSTNTYFIEPDLNKESNNTICSFSKQLKDEDEHLYIWLDGISMLSVTKYDSPMEIVKSKLFLDVTKHFMYHYYKINYKSFRVGIKYCFL